MIPGNKPGTHMTDIEGTGETVRAQAGLHDVRIHDIRRELYIRIGRRQNQPAIPRQAAPARQLVGVQTASPRNPRNRRPRLQRLSNDPRLQLIRPATTTAPHRQHFNAAENLS